MLACTRATSGMVLDAPSSNGPFQPVALMHFRGENRKFTSSAALCLWVSRGDGQKCCCHLVTAAADLDFVEENICARLLF